ncbi:glycerol-3-phosphate acyltransferase [Paenibacillaceae bacterium WGS1546]|uniref:glycerol-3-phosphate acyltransferase n=1 Tax=Cohnella sp. WGS1546 TaxID=3366810 RepID=UPI00372D62FA
MTLLWIALSFFAGSLMFSYWLGLAAKRDLRAVGDGNPGALNLWKAAGCRLGLLGIALDFLKGYVPTVWIAGTVHAEGGLLVPLALAPIAGHAFSPFLRGRGGKAIAVSFGVWSALTGFEASLAYAIILALLKAFVRYRTRGKPSAESDGLQVMGGMLLLVLYLGLRSYPVAILGVGLGNFAILAYKHRAEWRSRMQKGAASDRRSGEKENYTKM